MARSAGFASAWARALTLQERRGAPRVRRTSDLAARRLARWRAQAPFDDPLLFDQRLAQDGLSETQLLALLGEPTHRLARRLPRASGWAADLVDTLSHRRESLGSLSLRGPDQPEMALLGVMEPLVDAALARLGAGARALTRTCAAAPFDPELVGRVLSTALPSRLFPMLARTLAFELRRASRTGAVTGHTPGERFWSFVDQLHAPAGGLAFFAAYPVLARQVMECVDQWVETSLEFLSRLASDAGRVHSTFSTTPSLGRLVAVDGSLSDPHQGGRSVLIARFSSGTRVVYKPKSLAVDRHFQQFLVWVNAHGLKPAQWTLTILDRGDYGWAELVEPQECASYSEVERFYARHGSLLALLYILAAADFPSENVLAVGEHPILIDLESLFRPTLNSAADADHTRRNDSVLGVGLLKPHARVREIVRWEGGATDDAHPVFTLSTVNQRLDGPILNGEPVESVDYLQPLLDGFSATYRLVLERRSELLAPDGPLERFARDEVRLLPRPTIMYERLLAESFQPDLLRDALERDRFFDRLWVAVRKRPLLTSAIASEQSSLRRGDIPKFTTRPMSRDVWSGTREQLPELIDEPGLDTARRRVRAMSEADLAQQRSLLRAALTERATARNCS